MVSYTTDVTANEINIEEAGDTANTINMTEAGGTDTAEDGIVIYLEEIGETEVCEIVIGETEADVIEDCEIVISETEASETEADETEPNKTEFCEIIIGETEANETEFCEIVLGETEASESEAGDIKVDEPEVCKTQEGEEKARVTETRVLQSVDTVIDETIAHEIASDKNEACKTEARKTDVSGIEAGQTEAHEHEARETEAVGTEACSSRKHKTETESDKTEALETMAVVTKTDNEPVSGSSENIAEDNFYLAPVMEIDVTEQQNTPLVYTTRLDRMGFMKKNVTTANVSHVIQNIIDESKPKLKSLTNKKKFRKSIRTFNNLLKKINEINDTVVEKRNRRAQRKCLCKKADVPLKYCASLNVDIDDIRNKNSSVKFKLAQLNSIKSQIKKYFTVARVHTNNYTYFVIKNCHTEISEVYLITKGVVSEFYRKGKEVSLPVANKQIITLSFCCWYDRELKLKLFFNHFSMTLPSLLKKPHDCQGGCKCCCSLFPSSKLLSQYSKGYTQEPYLIKSQRNRISDLMQKSPSESTTNMSVINKALRFIPKISRKITHDSKFENNVQSMSINLIDDKAKTSTFYEVGTNGQLVTYLKSYQPQANNRLKMPDDDTAIAEENNGSHENTPKSENNSPRENETAKEIQEVSEQTAVQYEEVVSCPSARQNILKKFSQERISEHVINFLKTPHEGTCNCCCKSLNSGKNKKNLVVKKPMLPTYTNSKTNTYNSCVSITFSKRTSTVEFETCSDIENSPQNETKLKSSNPLNSGPLSGTKEPTIVDLTKEQGSTVNELIDLTEDFNYSDSSTVSCSSTSIDSDSNTTRDSELLKSNHTTIVLNPNDSINVSSKTSNDNFPSITNDNLANSSNNIESLNSAPCSVDNIFSSMNSPTTDTESGNLIDNILTKFKGIRLGIDEDGKVKISNTTSHVWSQEDVKILENILVLAQKEVDALKLTMGTNSLNDVTNLTPEQPILIQNPRSLATCNEDMPKEINQPNESRPKRNPKHFVDINANLYECTGRMTNKDIFKKFTKITSANRQHCVLSYKYTAASVNSFTLQIQDTSFIPDNLKNNSDSTVTSKERVTTTFSTIDTNENLGKLVLPEGGEIILTRNTSPPGQKRRIKRTEDLTPLQPKIKKLYDKSHSVEVIYKNVPAIKDAATNTNKSKKKRPAINETSNMNTIRAVNTSQIFATRDRESNITKNNTKFAEAGQRNNIYIETIHQESEAPKGIENSTNYDLEDFLASTTIVKLKVVPAVNKPNRKRPHVSDSVCPPLQPLIHETTATSVIVNQPPVITAPGVFINQCIQGPSQPLLHLTPLNQPLVLGSLVTPGFNGVEVGYVKIQGGQVIPNLLIPQIVGGNGVISSSTGQFSDSFTFALPKAPAQNDILLQPQRDLPNVSNPKSIGKTSMIRPKPLEKLLSSPVVPEQLSQSEPVIIYDDDDSILGI